MTPAGAVSTAGAAGSAGEQAQQPRPAPAAAVASKKIRLLFEDGETEMDCIEQSHEDAFTLESFLELHKQHIGGGKRLIIARVKTRDRRNVNSAAHFSYYSAHHLNKVLFRVRPATVCTCFQPPVCQATCLEALTTSVCSACLASASSSVAIRERVLLSRRTR